MFTYLRYYFYLAWHWNPRLAWFIVQHELAGEKKYGHSASGINSLRNSLSQQQRETASIYQPVNFYAAEWLLQQIPKRLKSFRFVDAGCGKGRALLIAAHHGFTKLEGFDLSNEMVMHALNTAELISGRFKAAEVVITCDDASTYQVPNDAAIIFMFNPFARSVMEDFAANIMHSLRKVPRELLILYANAVHKDVFTELGFAEVNSMQHLVYVQGSVLRFIPGEQVSDGHIGP